MRLAPAIRLRYKIVMPASVTDQARAEQVCDPVVNDVRRHDGSARAETKGPDEETETLGSGGTSRLPPRRRVPHRP